MKKLILKWFFEKELELIKYDYLQKVRGMANPTPYRTKDETFRGVGIVVDNLIEQFKHKYGIRPY